MTSLQGLGRSAGADVIYQATFFDGRWRGHADFLLRDITPGALARGGRMVELGYALGLGKRVIVVGPREHPYCHLAAVEWYRTWAGAQAALRPSALRGSR